MLPLTGIKVVSIEQAVSAPFASRQLADMGATVIKIEKPKQSDFSRYYDRTVSGHSSYFIWLNNTKKSITLDLGSSNALSILKRLLTKSDVLLHNLLPSTAKRYGIGKDLLEEFPHLFIICGICGYANTGIYAHRKAYDLLVQAEAGNLDVTGSRRSPAKAGIPAADIAAGMYAVVGILAGLIERNHTQKGKYIEISMFSSLLEWMSPNVYYVHYGKRPLKRNGPRHATIAPYGRFRCADGKTCFYRNTAIALMGRIH